MVRHWISRPKIFCWCQNTDSYTDETEAFAWTIVASSSVLKELVQEVQKSAVQVFWPDFINTQNTCFSFLILTVSPSCQLTDCSKAFLNCSWSSWLMLQKLSIHWLCTGESILASEGEFIILRNLSCQHLTRSLFEIQKLSVKWEVFFTVQRMLLNLLMNSRGRFKNENGNAGNYFPSLNQGRFVPLVPSNP